MTALYPQVEVVQYLFAGDIGEVYILEHKVALHVIDREILIRAFVAFRLCIHYFKYTLRTCNSRLYRRILLCYLVYGAGKVLCILQECLNRADRHNAFQCKGIEVDYKEICAEARNKQKADIRYDIHTRSHYAAAYLCLYRRRLKLIADFTEFLAGFLFL